jgi:hypothetical protein
MPSDETTLCTVHTGLVPEANRKLNEEFFSILQLRMRVREAGDLFLIQNFLRKLLSHIATFFFKTKFSTQIHSYPELSMNGSTRFNMTSLETPTSESIQSGLLKALPSIWVF